jgi:hypothetical protein
METEPFLPSTHVGYLEVNRYVVINKNFVREMVVRLQIAGLV